MRDNAVIIKELRSRMRGGRAFIILTTYLFLLSLFALAVFTSVSGGPRMGPSSSMNPNSSYIGTTIFIAISFFQLIMVSFLTPSFTVGSISREKEQKTYDLLVITKMSPLSIVIGKLVSATSYMLLLILTSLPVTSIVFVFGGISVWDFIFVYLITIATTIFFGSIGLFFSALVKKTQSSTILSYSVILFLILGTFILATFIGIIFFTGVSDNGLARTTLKTILIANPFYALSSVFSNMGPGLGPLSMFMFAGGPPGSSMQPSEPLIADWLYTLIVYSILSIYLLFATSKLISPLGHSDIMSLSGLLKRNLPEDTFAEME